MVEHIELHINLPQCSPYIGNWAEVCVSRMFAFRGGLSLPPSLRGRNCAINQKCASFFWPPRFIFDGIASDEGGREGGRGRGGLSHYFRRNFDGARMLTSRASEGASSKIQVQVLQRAIEPTGFSAAICFWGTFLFLLRSKELFLIPNG